MAENKEKIVLGALGILILVGICIGITLDASEVSGLTNDTVIVRVNVTNTEPDLYSVSIVPSPIDLEPGNTTTINCTGLIYDLNGWDDIATVNATLYDINYGDGTTFDNNYRYLNGSCESSCIQYGGSSTNASCTCQFNVLYYANNGSWQCNMTAADSYALSDTLNSSTATINTVIGIDVPNEIDYGDLSVTEISDYIQANITNFGNVPINISIRGYGGTDESIPNAGNLSMICAIGNITNDYERYAIDNSTSYSDMTNLTNTSTGIPNFDLSVRTNDTNYGNDTNTTYWRIQIPANIGGACNGTIEFSATETTI